MNFLSFSFLVIYLIRKNIVILQLNFFLQSLNPTTPLSNFSFLGNSFASFLMHPFRLYPLSKLICPQFLEHTRLYCKPPLPLEKRPIVDKKSYPH